MAQGTTRHNVIVPLDACNPPSSNKFVIWNSGSSEFELRSYPQGIVEGYICINNQDGEGYKTITISLEPTIYPDNVSGSFKCFKGELIGTQISQETHQSARSVAVWTSGSGGNLSTSNTEDARSYEYNVLYDIRRISSSWDLTGSLQYNIYQYEIDDVDYCLEFTLI